MSYINSIHTNCKKCVFSIYEGDTQTECALKYLDIYRSKNVEIIEAYDEEKEFYVINNKKCIGYREPSFFNRLNMSSSTLEDKIVKYNQLNCINYFLILDTKTMSVDEFEKSLRDISTLNIKPSKLIIIRYVNKQKDLAYSIIEDMLKKYSLVNMPWRINTILDEDMSIENILYGIITQNNKSRFVAYSKNSCDTLNSIIDKANSVVHKDLGQFNILCDFNKNNLIFSVGIYKYAMFNGENILDQEAYYTII
jgi:hypothetical protein